MGNATYMDPREYEKQIHGSIANIVVMLLVLCTLSGIAGNIVTVNVFRKPKHRSLSVNCILVGLAISDSVILTSVMSMIILTHLIGQHLIHEGTQTASYYTFLLYNYIWRTFVSVYYSALYFTPVCTLGISAERYLAICYPLQARILCTWRNAQIFLAANFLWSLQGFTRFAYYYIRFADCRDPDTNNTVYIVYANIQPSTENFRYVVSFVLNTIQFLVIVILLIFFNIRIYVTVLRANKDRSALSREQKRTISLTYTLTLIVIMFVATNTPRVIYTALAYCFQNDIPWLSSISSTMLCVNSATNFYIYCLHARSFRQEAMNLARSWLGCPIRQYQVTTSSTHSNHF